MCCVLNVADGRPRQHGVGVLATVSHTPKLWCMPIGAQREIELTHLRTVVYRNATVWNETITPHTARGLVSVYKGACY